MGIRGAAVAASIATAAGPLTGGRVVARRHRDRRPRRGRRRLGRDGTIVYRRPRRRPPVGRRRSAHLDAGCLVPGFVDCHVHLPFVGLARRRVRGAAPRASRTASSTGRRAGSSDPAGCSPRPTTTRCSRSAGRCWTRWLTHGTTAVELKTGYGLSVEAELRQARLARRLAAERAPQTCSVTLLACHAVPDGWDRAEWVGGRVRRADPRAPPPKGSSTPSTSTSRTSRSRSTTSTRSPARPQSPGSRYGCTPTNSGPAGRPRAADARRAERGPSEPRGHRRHRSPRRARATVAVLLPASTFFLRAAPAAVAALSDGGAALAIATDFNPGTSPVCSMPETIAMACTRLRARRRSRRSRPPPRTRRGCSASTTGWARLEPGKRADLLLLDAPRSPHVPYRPGHDPVVATIVGGEVVAERGA